MEGVKNRTVRRGLARRGPLAPGDIGIDETSAKPGHHYLTLVSDGSRVLYVAEDHDKAAIYEFWAQLSAATRAGIRSVNMCLWRTFLPSTQQHVPSTREKNCLDRFHVAGYFGRALDMVRCKENKALMAEASETLNGTKYAWLRSDAKVDNRSRRWITALAQESLKAAKVWAIKITVHRQ